MNNNLALKQIAEKVYHDYNPLGEWDRPWVAQEQKQGLLKTMEKHLSSSNFLESDHKRLYNELFQWGPIEDLIDREDIFDIIIQGPDCIWVDDCHGLRRLEDTFLHPSSFEHFVQRLCQESGIVTHQQDPFGNGQARNFRVHIAIPPLVKSITLTLRKQRTLNITWPELIQNNFFDHEQAKILEYLVTSQANFLVVGPTGSGKTTFLNSLIERIPSDQRILCLEDTDEITQNHPNICKMLSRECGPDSLRKVSLSDLVKQSLRMRPDRLIVGEVRGGEAKDLLQALATGHRGSLGTLHADHGRQALLRLEMLIQMGAPSWSLVSIRQLIQLSLDYIVVLRSERHNKGIKEICRLRSHESFGLLLEEIKTFQQVNPTFGM